jgi:DNA anti-recombination protein RmuC
MKKMVIIGGVVLMAGSIFSGCVSKGYIKDEITKSRTEITAEQAKSIKDSIGKLEMDINKRITNIEVNYALKSAVESDAYNREQKIMKDVEKRLEDIKASLKTLEDMKEISLEKFSQNLQSSVHILLKQLREQKEGLERAMEELDKLIAEPTTPPSTPNPEEQPPDKK